MTDLRLDSRRVLQAAGWLALLAVAFLVGFWQETHVNVARLLAGLPLVVALLVRPQLCLLLGVALLPFLLGPAAGGVNVTVSDAFFALAAAGAAVPLLLLPAWRERLRDTRPVLLAAAPFCAWLVAVVLAHPELTVAVNTVQYAQLVLLPLLLGALVPDSTTARRALLAFVVSGAVLALLWTALPEGVVPRGNKNPAGQLIGDAVLVLLVVAAGLRWRLLLPLLVVGLFFTQSRGALVGTAAGLAVVTVLGAFGSFRRTTGVVLGTAAVVLIGFPLLPADVRERTTDFRASETASVSELSAAEYSVRLRDTFHEQGWQLVEANPVFGVGPGRYETGTPGTETYTVDPHNLVIRTAGDLGYPGLAAFGVLVVGTAGAALARRRTNPYAVLALGVQASTLVHGLVDVYWVRGTPVLAWLLLGMAVNRRLEQRAAPRGSERGAADERPEGTAADEPPGGTAAGLRRDREGLVRA